jgi:hypothetical protein
MKSWNLGRMIALLRAWKSSFYLGMLIVINFCYDIGSESFRASPIFEVYFGEANVVWDIAFLRAVSAVFEISGRDYVF